MKREKQKRARIIYALIGVVFLMGVGYAAFNTNLSINGTGAVTNSWDIEITGITEGTKTGSAESKVEPTYTALTANMEANLYEKGDSIEYNVTIENKGTVDAKLEEITKDIKSTNEAVKITFSGYTKGERLYSKGNNGSTKTITVKIEYDSNYTGNIDYSKSTEINVTFNYTQAEGKQGSEEVPIPNSYLVTYDCTTNGGTSCTDFNEYLNEGDSIDLSHNAEKDGYTFVGWNTDKDAHETLETASVETSNTTLYAIYSKALNVTYTKDESVTSIGKETDTCNMYNNETSCEITLPETTPEDSYWYNGEEKIGKSNSKYTITKNITLLAKSVILPIMKSWSSSATTDFHASKSTITSVDIVDLKTTELTVPEIDETTCWDVSAAGNGSVRAWLDGTKLYIGGNGGVIANQDSSYLFANFTNLTEINLSKLDTSEVTDMSYMFYKSSNLVRLDLSSFNTSNVTNMRYMFAGAKTVTMLLKEINLSSFNTSNVTNMGSMFRYCSKLETIYATNEYKTDKVTTSSYMFQNCTSLIGGYGTIYNSSYTNKTYATIDTDDTPGYFTDGNSPIVVDVRSTSVTTNSITIIIDAHNKSNPTSNTIKYEFSIDKGTTWNESLDSNNEPSNVYKFENLTKNTKYKIRARLTKDNGEIILTGASAKTLNITTPTFTETESENGKKVTITYQSGCGDNLTCTYIKDNNEPITVSSTTQDVEFTSAGTLVAIITDNTNTVSSSYTIESVLPLMKSWTSSATTDFHNSTYKTNITSVDIVDLNTTELTVPNINNSTCWDVSKDTNGSVIAWVIDDPTNTGKFKLYIGGKGGVLANATSSYLFYNFSGLIAADLSLLNTIKATSMSYMFSGCSSLTTLDVSSFNTSKVTSMSSMFSGCSSLIELDLSSFNTSNVTAMYNMFANCTGLTILDVSNWNTSKVTNMSYMFQNCSKLTQLDVSKFDTSKVTSMSSMFFGCSSLTTLDVSSFNTSKVTNMQAMFYACDKLTTIYSSNNFVISQVTTSTYMFTLSKKVVGGNGTTYNSSFLDKTYAVIDTESTPGYFTEGTNNPITITYVSTSKTTNTITIVAKAHSKTSETIEYQFSNDGGETWIESDNNVYRFTNLTKNTTYPIKVKITDGDNHTIEYTTSVKTANISIPTFSETQTENGKTITITYQDGCGKDGVTCKYIKNNEEPVEVTTKTVDIDYTSTGTLIATITGDMDSSSKSYTITMSPLLRNGTTAIFNTSDNRNSDITKDKITTIEIKDNLNGLTNIEEGYKWDVSAEQNGSVMAWVITDVENTGMYHLYIGGNGGVLANRNLAYLFASFTNLTNVDLSKLDTSNVTDMSRMFQSCVKLTTLDLSTFNTSNVTDMEGMFFACSSLTTLNLSNFNTSKVTDMSYMFQSCVKLTTLDLSTFNTSKVTNMSDMFYRCYELTTLDLSTFNTSNVTDMEGMFFACSSLTTLDLSNWDTSNVTNMSYMFAYCYKLTTLDLSKFNTSNVTNMSQIFYRCNSLTTLDLSNWITSHITNMASMFAECYKLTTLDVSNFDTSKVTDMSVMFDGCSSLTFLNLSNFDTSKVTNMSGMFAGCSSLTTIDLSNFDTSKVTGMGEMFAGCSSLTTIDLSDFDTSKVTGMSSMFFYCSDLTTIDLSNWDTSNVTNMSTMFCQCSSLTTLDLSNWDTSNVTNMVTMFSGCRSLTTIYTSESFVIDQVTSSNSMFYECYKLIGGNGTTYNSTYVNATYAVIDTASTPGYFTDGTKATISNVSTSATSNSITTTVTATTPTGDTITNYQYSIDNGTNWVTSNNNTYTFTGLDANTTYTIKVKVNSTKPSTLTVTAKTRGIQLPKFTQDNDTVTITFPSGCGTKYTCQYKKDDDSEFTTVTNSSVDLEFITIGNHSIVAKISDDVNVVTRSYTFTKE